MKEQPLLLAIVPLTLGQLKQLIRLPPAQPERPLPLKEMDAAFFKGFDEGVKEQQTQ